MWIPYTTELCVIIINPSYINHKIYNPVNVNSYEYSLQCNYGCLILARLARCSNRWHLRPLLSLQWRHNEHDGVSNHRHLDCFLTRFSRCRSKKTSKLSVTGLCEGNSPMTGKFSTQRASNAENVSIWWRHYVPHCYSASTSIEIINQLHIEAYTWLHNSTIVSQIYIANTK